MDSLQCTMEKVTLKDHFDDGLQIQRKYLADHGSTDWKGIADRYFCSQRYKDAISAYTKGIEEGGNTIDLLVNRLIAYLRISDYKRALADAESVLIVDDTHTRSIYGKVKALYGMAFYRDAMIFLEKFSLDLLSNLDRKMISDLITEGQRFIAQSEHGDYPLSEIYKRRNTFIDLAEYMIAVEVKDTPRKGRGLFATKMIEAGELVLVSKAFAEVKENTKCERMHKLKYTGLSVTELHVRLIDKITQILEENPEKQNIFNTLFAGPKLSYTQNTEGVSGCDNIDMERIECITVHNAMSVSEAFDRLHVTHLGVWIEPSFINNSCLDSNCTWTICGDFFFVRAFRNIFVGEEILITYRIPDTFPLEENTNFLCSCRLCDRDRIDDVFIKDERAILYLKLKESVENLKQCTAFQEKYELEIKDLLNALYQSRGDAPELNVCLVTLLYDFGAIYFKANKFTESLTTFEKIYNLTKNLAAFKSATIGALIYIILLHQILNDKRGGITWAQILKKFTIITFGSVDVLFIRYPEFTSLLREYDLGA